jgi:hypothetical protein
VLKLGFSSKKPRQTTISEENAESAESAEGGWEMLKVLNRHQRIFLKIYLYIYENFALWRRKNSHGGRVLQQFQQFQHFGVTPCK